jgi:23S rRNA A2030 N6-methylase RlmJ
VSYDHHHKAGNLGDVFKHVALIAALDKTVVSTRHGPFRYADVFAGYAMNPVEPGKGQWEKGIKRIAGEALLKGNPHVASWARGWLNADGRAGATYPGSSWFAKEAYARRRKRIEMWLWDTEPEPIADLRKQFPEQRVHIFQRAAGRNEPGIRHADFVFVDPPNKKRWEEIHELVQHLDWPEEQSVLIWLPIGANTRLKPPIEDGKSIRIREQSGELGMCATRVLWAKGGPMIGCQLLYRVSLVAQEATREAIDAVAKNVKCARDGFLEVCHFPSCQEVRFPGG